MRKAIEQLGIRPGAGFDVLVDAAWQFQEEKKLNARVVRAKAAEVKEASIVRFLAVTSNYRRYLIDNNKDYEHAKSRIDKRSTGRSATSRR